MTTTFDFAGFQEAVRLVGQHDPMQLAKLADQLEQLRALLEEDHVWDAIAGMVADARDEAPRHPDDRDSGDVLDAVLQRLRTAAEAGAR